MRSAHHNPTSRGNRIDCNSLQESLTYYIDNFNDPDFYEDDAMCPPSLAAAAAAPACAPYGRVHTQAPHTPTCPPSGARTSCLCAFLLLP
jgi:hypothetical protein